LKAKTLSKLTAPSELDSPGELTVFDMDGSDRSRAFFKDVKRLIIKVSHIFFFSAFSILQFRIMEII
jgi:hypothetical protein